MGNVGIMRRKNRDGTIAYYLRWYEAAPEGRRKTKLRRLFKSEARPTRASRKEWERIARVRAYEHQRQLVSIDEGERQPTPMSVKDAYIDYVEFCYTRYTKGAYGSKERIVEGFVSFLEERYPDVRWVQQLSQRHTADWRHTRSGSVRDSTLAAECSHLQSFLTWCYELEYRPRTWRQQHDRPSVSGSARGRSKRYQQPAPRLPEP